MATTHVLTGMLLAVPVALVAPELAPAALLAGALGGFAPDADLYAGHRKTLHYPVYGPAAAALAVGAAAAIPGEATAFLAVFLLAAAVHVRMDVFGGGLELRPWEGGSDRAVYDHFRGRWRRPRRLVRYDGSPEDLLLAFVAAGPVLVAFADVAYVTPAVALLLGVSALYVAVRKPLAGLAAQLVPFVPVRVRRYVPERYHG
ncbi:metal-dependent hydrolase [Halorarum halophilum]|uniref:Metal-dependent hydrolase n=1 Tax=Halorarum halophilum TaxID=2743090 RepID=A0A7D5GD78_9EURY|nr:metal-dependent hydrolase [Halobaculum halophilum]QLG28806.1 metal-dependent hydrolase [Halobaculum halophilum]